MKPNRCKGPLLESLRGLLNFEDPGVGGKLLQIVLFGMPGINRKLRYAPSFADRLVRTEIRRMNREEMKQMLSWRFTQAGGRYFPFDTAALEQLFAISLGNPRTVCGIAQVALEYAQGRNRSHHARSHCRSGKASHYFLNSHSPMSSLFQTDQRHGSPTAPANRRSDSLPYPFSCPARIARNNLFTNQSRNKVSSEKIKPNDKTHSGTTVPDHGAVVPRLDNEKLLTIVRELAQLSTNSNGLNVRLSEQEAGDIDDFIHVTLRKHGLKGNHVRCCQTDALCLSLSFPSS